MQSGLIDKVAVIPANIIDTKGIKHVVPSQGAIYADKGYCTKYANNIALSKGCHLAAIKNNNMKDKIKEKDKWPAHLKSSYGGVFSRARKRVRYKGIARNQFPEFMYAICFNLKRAIILETQNVT